MKLKFVALALAIISTGCSSTGQGSFKKENVESKNNNFEKYSESNISQAPYSYSEKYFSKESGNFETNFNNCNDSYIEYVNSNSQGYKVARSFGSSDQEIISKGVIDCLFANDWAVYELESGKLKELAFSYSYLKYKEDLSQEELKKSNGKLKDRKKWYIKYRPELVK